jgi:predicted GIY-YIG superfamily endonuclease
MAGRARRYKVYVIELDRAVLDEPKFMKANSGHDPAKGCVYVGMTGLDPEKRFENHKAGYKSNRFVKKYGVRLRSELYDEYNPLSYEDAVEMESKLARILRRKGFAVWQK